MPLLLSLLIFVAGVLLFLAREPVAKLGSALYVTDTGVLFWTGLRRLDLLSLQVTGITQRGSVPDYVLITLPLMAAVGVFSVLYGPLAALTAPVVAWERPEQPVLVVLMAVGAVLALRARAYVVLAVCRRPHRVRHRAAVPHSTAPPTWR